MEVGLSTAMGFSHFSHIGNYSNIFSLTIHSISDPHSLDTVNRFNDSIDWITSGAFTDEDVEEAKLSVFSQV